MLSLDVSDIKQEAPHWRHPRETNDDKYKSLLDLMISKLN